MTAIETVLGLMDDTGTSLSMLAEYADLGTKENVHQMLKRSDLKVGTFVAMLEVLGYQLVVQNLNDVDDETVIDY